MSKIGAALRAKYKSPREAIKALGLDESLLKESAMSTTDLAKKMNAVAIRQTSVGALTNYLRPRLAKSAIAMDSKPLGIMAKVFEGVTGANFKAEKPKMATRIRDLTKGKLAADANLDDVERVLEMLEGHEVEAVDATVSEAQHNAMEAAAHGQSTLDIPEKVGKEFVSKDSGAEGMRGFLKTKGMADDDIEHAMSMYPKPATDEDPEEKKKREDKEKADKEAAAAKDAEMKDMVSKPAMDAALKATAESVAKSVRDTERGIRSALQDVKQYVGELPVSMAFDSAADVYRHALGAMGVTDAKTMHADALLPVLRAQPKPGARQHSEQAPSLGMDAAATESINKRFPGMAHISVG